MRAAISLANVTAWTGECATGGRTDATGRGAVSGEGELPAAELVDAVVSETIFRGRASGGEPSTSSLEHGLNQTVCSSLQHSSVSSSHSEELLEIQRRELLSSSEEE